MKKLNKIFSVLLTAAIMTSMLVTGAIPVGAADNAWSQFKTPTSSDEVMPNDLVATGLLTMAVDGTLYAYVNDGTAKLAKSVDGGRKWTTKTAPGVISAIFCSPSEANVVYFAVGNELFKSTDSGSTWATRGTVPAGTITAVAAALAGGSYKIIVGTANGGLGDTYYQNEGDFFLSFTTFGQFQTAAPLFDVMGIKLSPNFGTDQGIVVMATDGTNVEVHFSIGGGVFGGSLKKAVIPVTAATSGAMDFPSEFAMPASTVLFVGVGDGVGADADAGIWRVIAAAASSASPTTVTQVGGTSDIVSLDVSGSYAGTGTIVAGTLTGGVRRSSDSGANFSNPSTGRGLNGTGAAFVLMAGDYATSGKVYALQAAGAGDDESGFYISTSQGARFNAVSLLNSSIATINDAAFAANGDIYMITAATGGALSLWRYNGNWERVRGNNAAGTMMDVEVSPNYGTDKGVFFVDGANLINVSTNNGDTFSPQASASLGAIVDYEVIDLMTFVVANGTDIQRTTNNGFIWTNVSTANAIALARSSDGTALAALTDTGAITRSASDLGATWSSATSSVLAGASKFTFQNGSNNVLWATIGAGGGLYSIDLAATTVAWSGNKAPTVGAGPYDSVGHITIGQGIASGVAPSGQSVTYGICTDIMARKLSNTGNTSGFVAFSGFTSASALFIQPAAGANKLWIIGDSNELHMFTDQLAVAVSGVAIGSFTTTTAVVNWTAVPGADRYAIDFQQGTTALTDPYTSPMVVASQSGTTYTINAGLAANTTYTVSVWAVRAPTGTDTNAPRISFAGSVTFSTQPNVPPAPVGLAPAPAAVNIPTMPSFQWGAIAGATSYELELSTSPTFSPLTGTKITATVPAAAWTGTALANNTVYYWRVRAITATGTSDWVVSTFTTVAATPTSPPVTIPTSPVVTPTVTVVIPDTETPTYIWAIIGVGALLTVLVIVLIVRTRRVV